MKNVSSKIMAVFFGIILGGFLCAQDGSYPSWKHELQDLLGLEQSGKADRATFDALVEYLEEYDLMDEALEKGYDGMGGYLGFQIYLDNNQEWLLDLLRNPIEDEEELEELYDEEDEILEEEEEEDLDFLNDDEDEFEFDDADIDIDDARGFAGLGGGDSQSIFSVHSIGLDVGMYGPSMSYWNNDFLKDANQNHNSTGGQKITPFAMGPLFQGSATFKIGSRIRLGLSGGMWSGTAKAEGLRVVGNSYTVSPDSNGVYSDPDDQAMYGVGGSVPECVETGCSNYRTSYYNNSMTKDITVQMTPVTVMLGFEVFKGFYVGAGMGSNQVTQKIKDTYIDPNPLQDDIGNYILDGNGNFTYASATTTPETEFKGSGSRYMLCAGYEMPVGPLLVGVQGQYILGKYIQEVAKPTVLNGSENFYNERDNGTDGISFLINLGYSFGG